MQELAALNGESAATACFIARQPIFNTQRQRFGYELLFRSGDVDHFVGVDGDSASLQVLGNALSVFGLEALTGGRHAFINFPRGVLVGGHAHLLPSERVVIEVLETVEPDTEVLAACRELKASGYRIALDDFADDAKFEPLVALADIIKVDFRRSAPEERACLAQRYVPRGITLLAEKVETWEEHRQAAALGYALFQGYFFCRPETLQARAIRPSSLGYLRLLEEVSRPEVDIHRVAQLLERDAPLALNLLSYLNSALFGSMNRVSSLRHAALLLGPRKLQQWASVMAVLGLAAGKPTELFLTCIVRARFCELLGQRAELTCLPFELFLVGLLSSADALLERPMDDALRQFSVSESVRSALLEGSGELGQVGDLVRCYESANWPEVAMRARALRVPEADLTQAYQQALSWASDTQTHMHAGGA